MNFGKIFELLNNKNINQEEVFKLVDAVKNSDLQDEDNIREIVRRASKIANKNIDAEKENLIVQKIKTEGINKSLLEFL